MLIKTSFSLEINCGVNNFYGKCMLGEKCVCLIDECQEGYILVFSNDIKQPLCLPPIKENKAEINLDLCISNETQINIVAVCDDETSTKKTINILTEKPPACLLNEINLTCEPNKDPLAEKCPSGYFCGIEGGGCKCLKPLPTTIQTTVLATTIQTTTSSTTTTSSIEPCPYECCQNLKGYEDLPCDEGYVCCKVEYEYVCKKGNSCVEEKKAKGFSGWIIILIIVALSAIGGAVYYFSKTKVNLQDKYRF